MNRQQVEERLESLQEQRSELMRNLAAYNGAIQDCEYWLTVLDKEEVKPDDPE